MKSVVWLLILLFGQVGIGVAAPEMVIEQLNHDFGEVRQGEKVDYTFRFRNAGDQVLEISNVRSSCGCTAALLSARRIAPGDMGELQATFDSTRFRGAIHKVISLDSNDPEQPKVSFNLKGNVKAELVVVPERVNWGSVRQGEQLQWQLKISNLSSTIINLQAAETTNPSVSAELSGLTVPAGEQVVLTLNAKLPEGKSRLGGYVIIATDSAAYPQLRVPVSARLAK